MPRRSTEPAAHGRIAISRVNLDPNNEAEHPEEEIAVLMFLLETYGQQRPVLLDGGDNCVCGEGIITAAKRLGWKAVDYERTSLEGALRDAYRPADNLLATHSYLDLGRARVTALGVREALGGDFDPLMLGLRPAEYRALVSGDEPPPKEAGAGVGSRVIKVEGVRWRDRDEVLARVARALKGTDYEAHAY